MGDESQAALLTDRQRRFLEMGTDDEVNSDRGQRAARSRIRERLRRSLADFRLIVRQLENDDLDRVFEEEVEEDDPEDLLPYLAAFMFRHHSEVQRDGSAPDLSAAIEEGVEIAGAAMGQTVDARVDLSVAFDDTIETIKNRLETQGVSSVSIDGLKKLRDSGELTREEFNELYVEKSEILKEEARERVDEWEEGDDGRPLGNVGMDPVPYIIEELERRGTEDEE